ncbi:DUF4198 domain-containing protein [Magnetospirillum sp. UT-4]|uniref:DUF4198 domain-containing protein n=1 Tax=Magnetospirillum sp. UT-4 TaxID=2681467 RepID=UPI001381966F|nr:DUF4198 domain-containing protein [Magnetospirillum sp. UT-4]CAA7612074.1 Additional periplasmic component NikK of nickel ECF transporter [Magnetospirillum sp. UT-4]
MKHTVFAVAALAALTAATAAQAHFQLIHTPEVNVARAGELPLKLVFWHPFENGPVMDMEPPLSFFVVHKGARTDLMGRLKPITFQGAANSAKAYDASVPVKQNGDYVLVLTPAPYLERSEDVFIQQITKAFINKGGVPSGWNQPVGLPTEIVPLNKPTNILAGSTFTGRVLAEGKPAAGIGVEVEYMAAEPDMKANRAGPPKASPMPGGAVVAVTDDAGMFTFGIPKAGFWGFAALGAGPARQHQGKEMSQDAVLWVRAHDVQ